MKIQPQASPSPPCPFLFLRTTHPNDPRSLPRILDCRIPAMRLTSKRKRSVIAARLALPSCFLPELTPPEPPSV